MEIKHSVRSECGVRSGMYKLKKTNDLTLVFFWFCAIYLLKTECGVCYFISFAAFIMFSFVIFGCFWSRKLCSVNRCPSLSTKHSQTIFQILFPGNVRTLYSLFSNLIKYGKSPLAPHHLTGLLTGAPENTCLKSEKIVSSAILVFNFNELKRSFMFELSFLSLV